MVTEWRLITCSLVKLNRSSKLTSSVTLLRLFYSGDIRELGGDEATTADGAKVDVFSQRGHARRGYVLR